jgi:UDP-N-acetylmuramoyl-L-alanyl-D-glutamate--2,6-diaminopimelate ligase
MTLGTRRHEQVDLGGVLADRTSAPQIWVRHLTADSRAVQSGDAFIAVAGIASHGVDYVSDAITRGAVAVLWDPTDGRSLPTMPAGVTAIPLVGLRTSVGEIADRFYDSPSSQLNISGITGTNGKTTCAWLYAECQGATGAYLGTLGRGQPHKLTPTTHTTSDVVSIHRSLRALADDGITALAMEVSSHALDQGRVAAVRLPLTAFTNLTRDHLDYHGSMAAYGAAKAKIFAARGVEQAVINVGDAFGRKLSKHLPMGIELTQVQASEGDSVRHGRYVYAKHIDCTLSGLQVVGESHAGSFTLRSALVGHFNAENLLLVLGLLLAAGMSLPLAVEALEAAAAPPGRMEAFKIGGHGPVLVVDYAHTPDALTKALDALRTHASGDVWCIFGCGGDRDVGKRALMAQAAEAGADRLIVTDDNPRTEDPERIIAAITENLTGRVPVTVERNRAMAIRRAVAVAAPGDLILVAGKGHEDYQLVGNERYAYSDRAVARELAGAPV